MTIKNITKMLVDATEALEHLACGDDGLMDVGTTRGDVIAMLDQITDLVNLCEDELGPRLTRAGDQIFDKMVAGWFDRAAKVDAYRNG
jgi:hypothetical protein